VISRFERAGSGSAQASSIAPIQRSEGFMSSVSATAMLEYNPEVLRNEKLKTE
jgi:hypothetical protein